MGILKHILLSET